MHWRRGVTIQLLSAGDFDEILEVINLAAAAYDGVIPPDRWQSPYMSAGYLTNEITDGVRFYGAVDDGRIEGVMGIQDRGEVMLVRHAYTRPEAQRRGIGSRLIRHIFDRCSKPLLVGTWAAATWAVRFYERHGFTLVTEAATVRLLETYWSIPARQIETSVVLVRDGAA